MEANRNQQEALSALNDIKEMMEKTSRFKHISGWSIIIVGIYATIAAALAYLYLLPHPAICCFPEVTDTFAINTPHRTRLIVWLAVALAALAFTTVCLMSFFRARKHQPDFSITPSIRRALINFIVPMVAGGILCTSLILQEHYGLTSSIMLIFYGLALINCHHLTTSNIAILGYAELILGLVDCFMVSHAFLCWFLGFGIFHILFGIYFVVRNNKG